MSTIIIFWITFIATFVIVYSIDFYVTDHRRTTINVKRILYVDGVVDFNCTAIRTRYIPFFSTDSWFYRKDRISDGSEVYFGLSHWILTFGWQSFCFYTHFFGDGYKASESAKIAKSRHSYCNRPAHPVYFNWHGTCYAVSLDSLLHGINTDIYRN